MERERGESTMFSGSWALQRGLGRWTNEWSSRRNPTCHSTEFI